MHAPQSPEGFDRETFDEVCAALIPQLVALARRLSCEDPEDLAQETLLKEWQLQDGQKLNSHYTRRTLVNAAYKQWALRARRPQRASIDAAAPVAYSAEFGRPVDLRDLVRDVERKIDDPTLWTILTMRAEDRSFREIGKTLGMTAQSVASRLSRARFGKLAKLRERSEQILCSARYGGRHRVDVAVVARDGRERWMTAALVDRMYVESDGFLRGILRLDIEPARVAFGWAHLGSGDRAIPSALFAPVWRGAAESSGSELLLSAFVGGPVRSSARGFEVAPELVRVLLFEEVVTESAPT